MTHTPSTVASGHAERPRRTYRTGAVTRAVRIAAVVVTGAMILLALIRFPALPEIVPIHFNAVGQADAWGPRATVLPLLAISAAFVGGMTWVSLYPRSYNYPGTVTAESAQRVYRTGEQMIVWLTGCLALVFAGFIATTFLQVPLLPLSAVGGVGLVVIIVVSLVRAARAARAQHAPSTHAPPHT